MFLSSLKWVTTLHSQPAHIENHEFLFHRLCLRLIAPIHIDLCTCIIFYCLWNCFPSIFTPSFTFSRGFWWSKNLYSTIRSLCTTFRCPHSYGICYSTIIEQCECGKYFMSTSAFVISISLYLAPVSWYSNITLEDSLLTFIIVFINVNYMFYNCSGHSCNIGAVMFITLVVIIMNTNLPPSLLDIYVPICYIWSHTCYNSGRNW